MANPTSRDSSSSLIEALAQAKLHLDAALSNASAGSTPANASGVLGRALRAMDPTNSGCSNCSCGGALERRPSAEKT